MAKATTKTTKIKLGATLIGAIQQPATQSTKVWFCPQDGFWSPGVMPEHGTCPTCGNRLEETVA